VYSSPTEQSSSGLTQISQNNKEFTAEIKSFGLRLDLIYFSGSRFRFQLASSVLQVKMKVFDTENAVRRCYDRATEK